jgi:catechol 2,3-dioxygenase-like lactoylglutathione lyase family enzyme
MTHLTAPIKRTTVVVADLNRSLAFYRDLLGMSVYYDGEIGNPGASAITAHRCNGLRMVVLQSNHPELGMLGLMQLHNPQPPLRATEWDSTLRYGETILVIPTTQMRVLYQRMLAAGIKVVAPPTRIEVPNRPEIHEMMARDPDGVVVNLTQRGPLD